MWIGSLVTIAALQIGWAIAKPMRIDSSESYDADHQVILSINGRQYRMPVETARGIAAGLNASATSAESK
jgi:hypothetical protein